MKTSKDKGKKMVFALYAYSYIIIERSENVKVNPCFFYSDSESI